MMLTLSELKKQLILDKPVDENRNIAEIFQYVSNLSGFERIWVFTNFSIVYFDSELHAAIAVNKCRNEGKFKARPDRWSKEQPQMGWVPYNLEPTSTLFIVRSLPYLTLGTILMMFADMKGFSGVEEMVCGFYIKFMDKDSAAKSFDLISKATNLVPLYHHQIETEVRPHEGRTLYLSNVTDVKSAMIHFMSFPGFRKAIFEHRPDTIFTHAFIHFVDARTASAAEIFCKHENKIDCALIKSSGVPKNHDAGTRKSSRLRIILPPDLVMTQKKAVRFFSIFRGVELLHDNGLSFRTEQDAEAAAIWLNQSTNFAAEFIKENRNDPTAQLIEVKNLRVSASAVLCIWNYPNKHIVMKTLAKQTGLQDFTEIVTSSKQVIYVLFTHPEYRNEAVDYLDSQAENDVAIPFLYDPDCDVPLEAANRLGVEIISKPSTSASSSSSSSSGELLCSNAAPLTPTNSDTSTSSITSAEHHQSSSYNNYKKTFSNTEPSKTLWVGNLAPNIHYNDLRRLFARFGRIENIEIKKAENISFTYGLVEFAYLSDAIQAKIEMDDFMMDDNKLMKIRFV